MNNKKRSLSCWSILAMLVLGMFGTGCSSAPTAKAPMTPTQILEQDDVKGKPPVVFNYPLHEVRQAALRALVFVGCDIKQQQPYYVAGRRPNKIGLFVGSGGESVEVFLFPVNNATTHVWVDTDKSFVGLAGQQGWNKQVLDEMTRVLAETKTSPEPSK